MCRAQLPSFLPHMRLLAISDLHLGHPVNSRHFVSIGSSPEDWLILAGDVGETEAHLTLASAILILMDCYGGCDGG
jgi:predicted phosphodiesterase